MKISPSLIEKAFILSLIFVFLFTQKSNIFAMIPRQDKVRVIFLGIKFRDVPQKVQDIITWRMNAILESEKKFLLTKPDGAAILYGQKTIKNLLENQDLAQILEFAERYHFDYVYTGELTNEGRDGEDIFLVGELNRFDLTTKTKNTYKVNQSYKKFGNELINFRDNYVYKTVEDEFSAKPWIVGGLIVAAVIASAILISTGGGMGNDKELEPVDE